MTRRRRLATAWWVALAMMLGSPLAAHAVNVPFATDPDPTWQTNGRVHEVLYVGDTIYLGGDFTAVRPAGQPKGSGEVTRRRAAAFDAATGDLLSWNPDLDGRVEALAATPDGTAIFLGGTFTTVGGETRRYAAKVSAVSGEATAWNASIAGVRVKDIVVAGDGTVYLGGRFHHVNRARRVNLAAVTLSSGANINAWRPKMTQVADSCPPRCYGQVHTLGLSPDERTVYIAGSFAAISGVPRNSAAAVTAHDAQVLAFNPNVLHDTQTGGSRNIVYELVVTEERVYLCGDFFRVSQERHNNVAAVDPVTGLPQAAFNVRTDGAVNACAATRDHLYIGGHFDYVWPLTQTGPLNYRQHIAAIDAVNGQVTSWAPHANSIAGVYGIGLSPWMDRIGIGGSFRRTGGTAQQGFAQYS